jgi:hypothetical protein
MARITNYPDLKTFNYAELWSAHPLIVSTWYGRIPLPSEDKGDVHGVGARWKVDVMAACFAVWEGTLATGTRAMRLVSAAGVEQLENPPGAAFLPVYPGVNVLDFEAEAPPQPEPGPPQEPEPQPPTPPLPPSEPPRSFTVYGGGIGSLTRPVVTWWGGDLIFSVPYDWYLEAWEAGPKKLLERLADG